MKTYVVQMENIDGDWFDIQNGVVGTFSEARRRARKRLFKNQEGNNLLLRPLKVRIVERQYKVLETHENL